MHTRRASVTIAVSGLLICTGAFSYFATVHLWPGTTWPTLYPFSAVALGGGMLLRRELCLRSIRSIRSLPPPIFPIAGFLLVALMSVLWTVSPAVTPEAAILAAGVAAFGCWFGLALTIHEQVTAVAVATAVPVGLSILAIKYRPTWAYTASNLWFRGYNEDWKGIFGNRNSLSAISALGIIAIVGWFALKPSSVRGVMTAVVVVVEAITLWNTSGDTSLIALLVAFAGSLYIFTLWALKSFRISGWLVGGVSAVAIVLVWYFVFRNFDNLTELAGRSSTLSSRRIIWADVRGLIEKRPLLGYGYWGFWDRFDLTVATYARVGSPYGSAHNSMLEVLLMLGMLGGAIFLAICWFSVGGVMNAVWRSRSVATWWWATVMIFLVAENLTESFVLWHSYIWVLFLAGGLTSFGPSNPLLDDSEVDGGHSVPILSSAAD
ncbi:hypothetical protein BH10ACT2_BH10ACT2_00230 [soil metagenome]